jgi:3-hydroxyacyl-CoA dehydrogenase
MGSGIAQWLARAGCDVILHSRKPDTRAAFLKSAERYVKRRARAQKIDSDGVRARLERIRATDCYADFDTCNFVIEAVEEDLATKEKVIHDLEEIIPRDATLASTTSSLTIDTIARFTRTPERVVGTHFFNPVAAIRIVEVAHTPLTSAVHRERASRFVDEIGKLPLHVRDRAFFVVNRILSGPLLESIRAYTEHAASPAEIDAACVKWGMMMGPCAMLDMIGLDAIATGLESLSPTMEDGFRCREFLDRAVAEGRCGRKSGSGIYAYALGTAQLDPRLDEIRAELESALGEPEHTAFCAERIVALMVNEALICLHEGAATAREIDLGMTETICSERGPLQYYRKRGRKAYLEDIDRLCAELGERFELPAPVRCFLDSERAHNLLAES